MSKTVKISGEATKALSDLLRVWSGWPKATVHFADPEHPLTNVAVTDHNTRTFTANAERLVLNPNRLLSTITPFRLRQEAVLTGALLHEAGHARFSTWQPRNDEDMAAFTHADGTPVTQQELALARLMEEPRIEALMAKNANKFGAAGLGWTMRASAAHLLPLTELSTNPDQQIMDLITSWVLRAGREVARGSQSGLRKVWVRRFNLVLREQIIKHLEAKQQQGVECNPIIDGDVVYKSLCFGIQWNGEGSKSTLVDAAQEILRRLFPETDDDSMPTPSSTCPNSDESEEGEEGEGSGEGDESEESEEGEGSEGSGEGEGDEKFEALAAALGDMETSADEDTKKETEAEAKAEVSQAGGLSGGDGGSGRLEGGWRDPSRDERESADGAERYLRSLIEPNEAAKVSLSDSPSATVDGAALSAWKAGGQVNAPHFFRRTRREVEPSPPVKIAILVDISGSMDELQKPSAVLSWALASAALDLRNFAGRGQQVETTLIHWGTTVNVIQPNGGTLPGIREVPCMEGTSAMDGALLRVEEEIPGFFDAKEKPENRLLVQFTDWELAFHCTQRTAPILHKALANGVNMLSVVPRTYNERHSALTDILRSAPALRGETSLLRYNPTRPNEVWETAARTLR